MSRRQQQVELVRQQDSGKRNSFSQATVHLVTWVDSIDAVLGKEVASAGSQWRVEKVYSTIQEL